MEKFDHKAVEHLKSGNVILCLTDTIWGLSADAGNEAAAKTIVEIKERPVNKSFIVLVSSVDMLANYFDGPIPPSCFRELTQYNRPTTVILPRVIGLAPTVYAHDGTVGVRICKFTPLNQIIQAFGQPIISTSANLSGQSNPRSFKDIDLKIKQRVNYIVKHKTEEKPYLSKPSRIVKWLGDDSFKTLRP